MTTDSPCTPGKVETRTSSSVPLTRMLMRPSCGNRRSAMSMAEISLIRETTAANRSREGSVGRAGRRRREADTEVELPGFDVNIRRALFHGLAHHVVDEFDRRLRQLPQVADVSLP